MKLPSLVLLFTATFVGQVSPPPTSIFDTDAVHEIHLAFKQADWYEQLTTIYTNFRDNTPYIEGSLRWGQYQFETVGVRFKGNSSYNGARTRKKPFRIKLNEFVKGQKIDGMASFGLSNAWNDPSFVREKPYYELAAAAGLPSPRSNFAALYVNDEYWGLYILGEIVNGDFLEHHFGKNDGDGNLYKATDLGANLAYLGADPALYQRFFSKESKEEENDWTDLIELARIFDQTPIAELSSKLEPLVDVDSFLTALALDNLTANLDSYVGLAQNYYLYRRSSDQKWVWIPWDPSLAFGALSQGLSVQQLRELPLEWPQTENAEGGSPGAGPASTARPVATKLWGVPEYKLRYRQIYQKLIDRVFISSEVIGRMNGLRDMIRPWVEKDTQKLVTMAQFEAAMISEATPGGGPGGGFQGGAPALQPFIEGRVASVKAQLVEQAPVSISAVPLSLVFAQVAGAGSSGVQELALSAPGATSAARYSATTSAPWIVLSATSGAFPARIGVSTNVGSMAVGTYTGRVTVIAGGATNGPIVIPVSLTVVSAPALVTTPASLTFSPVVPPLTQSFSVASTVAASPFTLAISDSTCGDFLSATPAIGTTPAVVTVTANATNSTIACTARINVTSAGLAPAIVQMTLTVADPPSENQTPRIDAITNSASYATGPLSPGTLATIFGTNLGSRNLIQGAFSNGGLATDIGGLRVTFDGVAAPILYSRFDQIGVSVPFEVDGKTRVVVRVVPTTGEGSPPFQQSVSPTSPAIYTTSSTGEGQASVINENGSINGAGAAAPKGSIVSIYMTGAGQMMPAGRSGTVATTAQTIAAATTVTIGGRSARLTYAGAAPGSLQGLYQINAVVPQDTTAGTMAVQVTVGGIMSPTGVTMYVQ